MAIAVTRTRNQIRGVNGRITAKYWGIWVFFPIHSVWELFYSKEYSKTRVANLFCGRDNKTSSEKNEVVIYPKRALNLPWHPILSDLSIWYGLVISIIWRRPQKFQLFQIFNDISLGITRSYEKVAETELFPRRRAIWSSFLSWHDLFAFSVQCQLQTFHEPCPLSSQWILPRCLLKHLSRKINQIILIILCSMKIRRKNMKTELIWSLIFHEPKTMSLVERNSKILNQT